ncbi:MAG TPA: extracellular solute-binding protein [Azospirillaceae bacterium]|nr:extracellular solute-binding protein [Azospirillaceae bacterium]
MATLDGERQMSFYNSLKAALGGAAIIFTLGVSGAKPSHAEKIELCVFEWEGYISPFADDFAAYAKSKGVEAKLTFMTGVDGKPSYITSADDIFQVVRGEKCDIVTPTHNYYKDSNARLMQILAPINVAEVANFSAVVDNLRTANYAEAEGKRYAVPLLGGGYSLAYNADRVKEAPTSWQALTDPRFKNRTSITGAQYEANVYVAALLSGAKPTDVYAWDSINPEAVGGWLRRMAGNARVFWDANPDIDLMANDLDLITDYGFGVAFANAKGQNWKFASPAEPTTVWLDNISLTPSAVATPAKSKAAHLLLDFMLSPEIQARLAQMYGVVVPNPKALDHIPAEQRDKVRVGSNDFYKAELLWRPLDKRTRNGFKGLWDEAAKR